MNPGLAFLLFIASVGGVFGFVMLIVFQHDRIALMFLRAVNAPVYVEARRVAALIYQHPDQWTVVSDRTLKHPEVGEIWCGNSSVSVEGAFGRWEPTTLECAILREAIRWYRVAYIKHLLTKALDGTQ